MKQQVIDTGEGCRMIPGLGREGSIKESHPNYQCGEVRIRPTRSQRIGLNTHLGGHGKEEQRNKSLFHSKHYVKRETIQ